MNQAIRRQSVILGCLAAAIMGGLAPPPVVAGTSADPVQPATVAAPAAETGPGETSCARLADTLLPPLDARWLGWISAVLVLALLVQTRPVLTLRNLDALVLALTCLALLGRDQAGLLCHTEHSVQWWSYLLLAVFCGYWLVRGLTLLFGSKLQPLTPNASTRGLSVFVLGGLVLVGTQIATAPISAGAKDALVGGLYTARTGKLPYGDVSGADARSPLLYLTFAGLTKILPPRFDAGQEDTLVPMTWTNREQWQATDWATAGDMAPIRAGNALLFLLLFGGLAWLGHRLHSAELGQTLVVLLCIHPAALECFSRPEIMLPTVLLVWAVALIHMPWFGGLFSGVLLVLAGLAWPWAWLVGLGLLGYWLSRGLAGFTAVLGSLAGVAGIGAGLLMLVAPSLPRADGAVRAAGLQPAYSASLSEDGAVVIRHYASDDQVPRTLKSQLWGFLLNRDTATLGQSDLHAALPPDVIADQVMFQRLAADAAARQPLQEAYRTAVARADAPTRLRAALRSVLEATWLPQAPRGAERLGTWALWNAANPDATARWTWVRRGCKLAAGLLALVVLVVLTRRRPAAKHHLLGGLLAIAAAAMLASSTGPVDNLVWLLALVLATLAGTSEPVTAPTYVANGPRITVNP